jgi:hypothetical protein
MLQKGFAAMSWLAPTDYQAIGLSLRVAREILGKYGFVLP